jgi:hypothetical protein
VGVGEVGVVGPVVGVDVVFAGAEVVADLVADGGVGGGLGLGGETGLVVEGEDGFGVEGGEEFAFGIGPEVFGGGGDVEEARGDEGQVLVLVDGSGLGIGAVGGVGGD